MTTTVLLQSFSSHGAFKLEPSLSLTLSPSILAPFLYVTMHISNRITRDLVVVRSFIIYITWLLYWAKDEGWSGMPLRFAAVAHSRKSVCVGRQRVRQRGDRQHRRPTSARMLAQLLSGSPTFCVGSSDPPILPETPKSGWAMVGLISLLA